MVAQVRGNRFKLQHAIEEVDNQIALLRANIATLKTRRATLARAKADYDRAIELRKTPGAIAPQDVDQRREAYDVGQAQVTQALEAVYQIRVGLGLPAKPQKAGDDALGEVPPDLDQKYSTVRQALATLLQSVAPLNFFPLHTISLPGKPSSSFTSAIRKGTSTAFTPSSSRRRPPSSWPRPSATRPRPTWTRPN